MSFLSFTIGPLTIETDVEDWHLPTDAPPYPYCLIKIDCSHFSCQTRIYLEWNDLLKLHQQLEAKYKAGKGLVEFADERSDLVFTYSIDESRIAGELHDIYREGQCSFQTTLDQSTIPQGLHDLWQVLKVRPR